MPQIPSADSIKANLCSPNLSEQWNPLMSKTPKSVLVLGNGFDIDLGMNTKYESFVNSEYWPFKKSNESKDDSLPSFLNHGLREIDTWYDLEEALAKFASKTSKNLTSEQIAKTKDDYTILCQALESYLKKEEDAFIARMKKSRTRRMRPAHRLLQYFLHKEIRSIYTFNYTSIRRIANALILDLNDECTQIHGSLDEANIILGAGDQRNLDDKYFGFYKSANPYYESNNLVEDLNTADEVYIFGHSLGLNDHDYFSDFFKMASKAVHRPYSPGKIKLRIFTYDDNSEMAIKKQLMKLTDKHLLGLYAHCDFKILKTCEKYQDDWMLRTEML